ncbi:MAG TPA: prepilin-type N-terminal cleavage/methylation domain-containing protein [Blastocatellia bacterium]|nr:prepilin-type N-terminal cleavage/methylation domain-containing protein [Blastocatellia bacterium]
MRDQEFGKEVAGHTASESGFSLIEMLIAVVVITFGLVSVVGISVYVSRANSVSNNLNVLAAAAQDQVDRLRTAPWTSVSEDPMLAVGGAVTLPSTTGTAEAESSTSRETPHTATTQGQNYRYVLDPNDPHRAQGQNTPSGTLNITWQVRQGPTPDVRYVTVRVVQENAPPNMRDGYVISTIITRN